MAKKTYITKSYFHIFLGQKAIIALEEYILALYDEWIYHGMLGYSFKTAQEKLQQQATHPVNKIREIIYQQNFSELAEIFESKTVKSRESYIRFLEEFIIAFFPYYNSIIDQTYDVNEKYDDKNLLPNETLKFQFMMKFFITKALPIIHANEDEALKFDIIMKPLNDSTKSDVDTLTSYYEKYRNSGLTLNSFSETKWQGDRYPNLRQELEKINDYFDDMYEDITVLEYTHDPTFQITNDFKVRFLKKCNQFVQQL